MRDDQVRMLLQKELMHLDNISVLRSQQNKLRIDSLLTTLSSPKNLIKAMFKPFYLMEEVEKTYKVKAQEFNDRLQSEMAREKLKI